MSDRFVVNEIRREQSGDTVQLSAQLDGFHLWYRFPKDQTVSLRGDVFLAAAVMPAMVAGKTLEIESSSPVSPTLLEGIREVQDVLHCWDSRYEKIDIVATCDADEPLNEGVGSFFSGGIDGSYTFVKHRDEITHLIFVQGIDMQFDNDALFSEALLANRGLADRFGKTLIPVQSNIRRFCHPRGAPWTMYHGGGLTSFALALGFPKVYVAASHTYANLFPWGSHPLTDHLWSTEAVRFVHDGAEAERTEKLKAISACPECLEILRVCWQDAGYNCGSCEKCLRTRIALRLLGLKCPTMQPLESVKDIRKLMIYDDNDLSFFRDNWELAQAVDDPPILRSLHRSVRRYELKRCLVTLDRLVLGGWVKRGLGALRTRIRGR